MTETTPTVVEAMANERTHMAAERTLMAWTRTALSLITFGFTIYKFLEAFAQQAAATKMLRHNSPRNVGLTLIGIGIFALVIACLQHLKYSKMLGLDRPYKIIDLSLVVALLLGILGIAMFVSIIFRMGPLG